MRYGCRFLLHAELHELFAGRLSAIVDYNSAPDAKACDDVALHQFLCSCCGDLGRVLSLNPHSECIDGNDKELEHTWHYGEHTE